MFCLKETKNKVESEKSYQYHVFSLYKLAESRTLTCTSISLMLNIVRYKYLVINYY